jgi:hypothetical protein
MIQNEELSKEPTPEHRTLPEDNHPARRYCGLFSLSSRQIRCSRSHESKGPRGTDLAGEDPRDSLTRHWRAQC